VNQDNNELKKFLQSKVRVTSTVMCKIIDVQTWWDNRPIDVKCDSIINRTLAQVTQHMLEMCVPEDTWSQIVNHNLRFHKFVVTTHVMTKNTATFGNIEVTTQTVQLALEMKGTPTTYVMDVVVDE